MSDARAKSVPQILVLEDDPDVRNMLTMTLEDQDYSVVAVENALAAVDAAAEQSFDLIVADIRMEGMDGLEAIRLTKQHQPGIGTLVVSGYATPEEQSRADSLGVGGYLKKPFQVEQFLKLVREQLAKGQREVQFSLQRTGKRAFLRWSLTQMCRLARESGLTTDDWAEVSVKARRAALRLGLDGSRAEDVELAVLLAMLQSCGISTPGELSSYLPEPVSALLVEGQSAGRDSSKEGQLVAFYLAKTLETEIQEDWATDFVTLDSELSSEPEPVNGVTTPQTGTLHTLARALEGRGDPETANRAYEKALEKARTAVEKTDCHLGLMRTSFALSRTGDAQTQAALAVKAAGSRGPVAQGLALLETGWTFLTHQHSKARSILTESVSLLEQSRRQELLAQARIALAYAEKAELAPADLETLFHPNNLSELATLSRRMMPALLETMTGLDAFQPYLGRLCVNFPREVAKHIPHCEENVRLQVAQCLLESSTKKPQELVELLAVDQSADVRKIAAKIAKDFSGQAQVLVEMFSTGALRVNLGGQPIADALWKTVKVRGLLGYLAYEWGKPYSIDYLVELFWPGKSRERGRKNLWFSTSVIRKALAEGASDVDLILRDQTTLRMNTEQFHWHDVNEIDRAIKDGTKAAQDGDCGAAITNLEKLYQHYHGPYLEGLSFDWAEERRREMARVVERGLGLLGELHLKAENFQNALSCGRFLLEIEPYSQEGFFLIIVAHHGLGQPEHAIREFEKYERILKRELGAEPPIKLVKAYQRVKYGLQVSVES